MQQAQQHEAVAADCYLAALRGERSDAAHVGARLMARTDRMLRARIYAEGGARRNPELPRIELPRGFVGPYAALLEAKQSK